MILVLTLLIKIYTMQELKGITFDEFVILRQKDFPSASGDLSKLLRDIEAYNNAG